MKRNGRTRRTRRRKGGVVIGTGANGVVYTKPDEVEKLVPEGCEWKDGYVMKVFETYNRENGVEEWIATKILRNQKIQGIIYPEKRCNLIDGRLALFSPFGGQTVAELFYSKGPIITEDDVKALHNNTSSGEIVRNREQIPNVIEALQRLIEQVKTMNTERIYHNDIHEGNIVYDGKDTRLIDFGESSEEGGDDTKQIERIIDKLKQTGGLRKKAVSSRRRTRRHRSYRSR